MKRSDLLATLKRVSPALGSKEFSSIMTCLCFDGAGVTAYDDRIALWTPCDIGFVGGCPGQVLLDFLGASSAEQVEFTPEKTQVRMKMGRTKLTLPLHTKKDFIFDPVLPEGNATIKPTPDLLSAITRSQLSIGVDPSQPTRLGVTLYFEKDSVRLLSSDDLTVTGCLVDLKVPKVLVGKSVIATPRFLETLTSIAGSDPCEAITLVGSQLIVAEFKSETRLYSRVLEGADPKQFLSVLKANAGIEEALAPIPAALKRGLERACLLVGNSSGAQITLAVSDSKLTITADSAHGHMSETLKLEGDLPDLTVKCAPARLLKAAAHAEDFTIGACIAFGGDDFVHLISVSEA